MRIQTIQTTTTQIMMTKKRPLHYRHEFKFTISYHEDFLLSSKLKHLLKRDGHANSQGFYPVSSLYFDTPEDRALRQKIDGINRREKFRIRYYGHDLSFFKLERKLKINGLTAKQSTRLHYDEVKRILEGDPEFLLFKEDPLTQEFYAKIKGQRLSPSSIVQYDREAFLYPPGNVRITFDRRLRTGPPHLFLEDSKTLHNISENITVLEIKYDEFLPDVIRALVQIPHRQHRAFSKYAYSRQLD